MAAHVMHLDGSTSKLTDDTQLDTLIAELDSPVDPEHADVAVAHESEWTIQAFAGGRVILENVEADVGPDSPVHLNAVSRAMLRELFVLVAVGDIERLRAHDWQPGYG